MEIIEGEIYNEMDVSSFQLNHRTKMQGRKVLIRRIYTRLGATERSFVCVFLAKTKRGKDYEHTFNEYEKLASLLKHSTNN